MLYSGTHHFAKTTNCSNLPWLEYKKLILERLGDVCDDPMVGLMKLRKS